MGQLVFQATLGGQVNLVGPNTASTFNINVPAVAGNMVTTGDTGTVTSTMLASSLSLTTPNINVATGTSLKVSSGFYSTSSSSFTFTDGIVMDYTTGLGRISVGTSDGLAFYNAGVATTELMRLDSSGNLGLGVTPSAWSEGRAIERKFAGTADWGYLQAESYRTTNAYYNGGWKYGGTGAAASYAQVGAAHQWYSAPSGTAGNPITFTQAMTLDSSGNLLVGTTDASNSISGTSGIKFFPAYSTTTSTVSCVGSATTSASSSYILYSSGAGAYRFYVDYGGTIHATATSIAAISDATLKTNVKDLETGLTEVMALKPRRFDWINGDAANVAGFIAQEVEQVLPELVVDSLYSQDEEGNEIYKKNLKMGDILPTLVKAIQEQQALIKQLQADVAALKV